MEDKPSEPFVLGPDTDLKPGETLADLRSRLGPVKTKLAAVSDKIVEGEGTTPTTITFHPAVVAAKKIGKENT